MVGLDLGNLPWRNETPEKLRESRRLFYVGLTRARDEVHMLYSVLLKVATALCVWGVPHFWMN
jgi:superfamily I DNA/RNA helicase